MTNQNLTDLARTFYGELPDRIRQYLISSIERATYCEGHPLAGRSSRHRPSRGEEFFFFSRSINSSAFDCQGIPSLFEYLWIFGLAQVKISDMAALDSKCRFHPSRELRGELGIEPNNHAASMGWLSRWLAKRRHQRGRFITVLFKRRAG